MQHGPVYVYTAGIRIWHWVTALCTVVLGVTGYFIGSPLPSVGGEAYDAYLFGWIRFAQFSAGMILGVAFVLRLCAFLVGVLHAWQICYIPFLNIGWWNEVFAEGAWYLFIGHNPLAQFAMFTMFTMFMLPLIVLLLTGFALYAIFSMIRMYMALREDMTHRRTAVTAMVSSWRSFR